MNKSAHEIILFLHSLVRWLVLMVLLATVIWSFIGWKWNKVYTHAVDRMRNLSTGIAQLQLLLGIVLYTISPLVKSFWQNTHEALHIRPLRFFGMEHSLVMVIAVFVITIGSAKVQKVSVEEANKRYRVMFVWFLVGILLIVSSIPWWFSPLTSRPMYRPW